MSSGMMPRLGPSIVRRQGLEEWLGRFRGVPVRFLVAPPGFGKTTAMLGYLRHAAKNGVYCALPPEANADTIRRNVARVLHLELPDMDHGSFARALAACTPMEIGVDCADVPDAQGVEAILRLIEDVPDGVFLLIACRSRAAFGVGRLVSKGTAVFCDAERLAFNVTEIRHLAETCGVSFLHTDAVRMCDVTDGWPLVVSGALRKAAEDGCNLAQAFENWRMRHGHLFNEFVAQALRRVPEGDANLVLKLMSGSHLEDGAQLQALEEQGLFVVHTSDGYRPLRVLSRRKLYDRFGRSVASITPMQVRLFGWFLAEIDRQTIDWVRRRDRQIFKYIALQPNGKVSRAEIGRVFWPGAERHLVAQSLRTACSNIRKAIAQIVGVKQVDAYFRAGDELAINLENVIVDVNRFILHANDADEEYMRGELRPAYAHYRSAARLYRDDLLPGDAPEPWVGSLGAELKHRHVKVLARIAEVGAALGYEDAEKRKLRRVSGS